MACLFFLKISDILYSSLKQKQMLGKFNNYFLEFIVKTTIHHQLKQTMRLSALAMSLLIDSVTRGISKSVSILNSIDGLIACSPKSLFSYSPINAISPESVSLCKYENQSTRTLGFGGQTFWHQICNIRGGNPGKAGVS